MEKNAIGHSVKTFFGGMIALGGTLALFSYLIVRMSSVYRTNENTYNEFEFAYSDD